MNQNLTQLTQAPDPTNAAEWLEAKVKAYQAEVTRLEVRPLVSCTFCARWVKAYQAEVTRLEAQLKHAQILLKGHQIWLDEVKKQGGENGHNQT